MRYTATLAALVAAVAAGKGERTFAVLRFQGNEPLTEGRGDPIVNFGVPSGHVHTFQGANGISLTSTGDDLKKSSCTTANIEGDMSAYWVPTLFFHDEAAGTFEKVEMFYMSVYYFFDNTDDKIVAFPDNLQMLAGEPTRKDAPATAKNILANGLKDNPAIQPVGWTCPRSGEAGQRPDAYPKGSNGLTAGMANYRTEKVGSVTIEKESGEGVGFPDARCDGYASPLRADIHFPSCYNPEKGPTDYKNNVAYPNEVNGRLNCPPGWLHMPHLFYEMYWNTPKFDGRWTPGNGKQPFILANGDQKGYSLHADFLNGWDSNVLQNIIDNCNAGTAGMDKCPGVKKKPEPAQACKAPNPHPETIAGVLKNLPGNNPWYGFGGAGGAGSGTADLNPSNPQQSANSNPQPSANSNPQPSPSPEAKAAEIATGAGSGAKAVADPAPSDPSPSPAAPSPSPSPSPSPAPAPAQESGKDNPKHKQSVRPSSAAGELEGWKYAGCYEDNSERVIHGVKFPKLESHTNDACVKYCNANKYTVAGMENGAQCFCGMEVLGATKIDDSRCSSACEGKPSTMCGGSWALTVYSTNGSAKP